MANFLGKVYFSTQIGVVGWTRGLVMSFKQILNNLYNYPFVTGIIFYKITKIARDKTITACVSCA